jgi:integrase/recombinase XerD
MPPLVTAPAIVLEAVGGDLTRGSLTLERAVKSFLRWMESRHYAKNTLLSYGDSLGHFLTFATGARLRTPSDLTVTACEAYFLWLSEQRGASARTVSHRRSVLVSLWRWLEHEGLADRNTPGKTYPIKVSRRAPQYLEPHQVDALLAKLAALTDPGGRRDHAIAATLFYGGLRVGELSSLQVVSVDLIARRIRILHAKGDKDRTIVLAPRLQPILAAYLLDVRPRLFGAATSPFLVLPTTPKGRHGGRNRRPTKDVRGEHDGLLERSIYAIIRRRARALLGLRLSPHMLRHACASYLIYHGAQPETVQRHLGHAQVTTTLQIYVHIPRQRQDEEIARAFA